MEIAGGDDAHAVGEQRRQQPVQDHRVGHVADVELVEADQAKATRDAPPEFVQWIGRALEFLQFAVHLAHELVEVQPCLARQRHGLEEAVHQEALAPPHATVHVDAARNGRAHQQLGHGIAAPRLVGRPFVFAALQRCDAASLRFVGRVATLGQRGLVKLLDAHIRN